MNKTTENINPSAIATLVLQPKPEERKRGSIQGGIRTEDSAVHVIKTCF